MRLQSQACIRARIVGFICITGSAADLGTAARYVWVQSRAALLQNDSSPGACRPGRLLIWQVDMLCAQCWSCHRTAQPDRKWMSPVKHLTQKFSLPGAKDSWVQCYFSVDTVLFWSSCHMKPGKDFTTTKDIRMKPFLSNKPDCCHILQRTRSFADEQGGCKIPWSQHIKTHNELCNSHHVDVCSVAHMTCKD